VVGDEPFGVVLPDDLIWNGKAPGALRQMAEISAKENAGVIAVEEVPREDTNKYGIVDATPISDRAAKIKLVVEKPKPAVAPSNLAIVGRYVLPGRIFELLEKTTPGAGGEIQLTDAIETLLSEQSVLAYRFAGTRFDCGNKLGLVKATLHMALQDEQIGAATRELMKEGLRGEG
jgi:UTP--glucose-1-phosphate uridylyltransferase